jgi:hypothetical protein
MPGIEYPESGDPYLVLAGKGEHDLLEGGSNHVCDHRLRNPRVFGHAPNQISLVHCCCHLPPT